MAAWGCCTDSFFFLSSAFLPDYSWLGLAESDVPVDNGFLDVLYDEERGKPEDMCEVLDRVEVKGEAKDVDKARLESIKNRMKNECRMDHPSSDGPFGNTQSGTI